MRLLVLFLALGLCSTGRADPRARPLTPPHKGNCQNPRWSPDGSRLAYEVNDHDRKVVELYVVTPGGSTPVRVRPHAPGASGLTAGFRSQDANVAQEISWSPASLGRFVYSASGPQRDYDLYLDSGDPLSASLGTDGGPAWSPTGDRIVFTSARTGQGDLYALDVHDLDAPPLRLTRAPTSAEVFAAWAPDGRSLVYVVHDDAGDNLYLLDDIGRPEPRKLTGWDRTQTRPVFSPDGHSIAFYSNHVDPDRFDLYVLPLGGQPRLMARDVILNGRGPSWTPDGRHLVFVRDEDARFDPVCAVPVDRPQAACAIPTGTVGNGDLDVVLGAEGRVRLAVAAQGVTGDARRDFKRIYVLDLLGLP
ncbi:MAG: PD40 domain-containing protein [Deltaproteobacteria bacterium]|nr:PD40 domain-containing protein [Deltaproteobacteria bacterium]